MIRRRASSTPRRRKATTTSTVENSVSLVQRRTRGGTSQENSVSLEQHRSRGGTSPGVNGGVISFAESVKERVLGFLTPTLDNSSLPAIVESSESGFEEGNVTGGAVPTSSPNPEVFVGAREFFAERETRDRLNSDYSSASDTPSRLRDSTRRLSIRKPFNQYIAYSSDEELEEWQKQARSDYTYSTSLTYRARVTPDRKIGSPNMARRGLRGGNMAYIKSPDFSSVDLSDETDDSSHLNLRTRTILRPMDALSDTSDGEGEAAAVVEAASRRTRSSRSRSTEVTPAAARINGSTLTRTITSYTTTRTLHCGLDADSDVDDATETTTVTRRATPFMARSGTPLARAPTPLGRVNSRNSVSSDAVGRGYTLAKGAIAEDVEEEEEAENELSWRILSWRSVKRITTYITTSVVMMAVKSVMAQDSDASTTSTSSASGKVSRSSLFSSVNSSSRRMVGAGAGMLTASRDHLRKRPILLWIPLIPLLIFLALVASWWLLQSGAKTDDSADPTQPTDGPSFLSYTLSSASELTNLVINGIYYGPILVWEAVLGLVGWVVSVFLSSIFALWAAITSMAMWLGSVVHSGLAYILQTMYLILDLLHITALAIASFFSSSFSYVFGFLLPTNGSEENTASEAQSWSASAWVSSATSMSWVSQAYTEVSAAAQRTQTWLWDGWLWLVISVADVLTAGVSSLLWLLGSLWSLLWYLIYGLWTVLVYIFTGTTGLLSSAASTVSSLVVEVFSTAAGVTKLVFLPLFRTSESTKTEDNTVFMAPVPPPVDGPKVSVSGMSIEDIVNAILGSAKLRALITSVSSENAANSQATSEEIKLLVKSLVEGELETQKSENAALLESHVKAAALKTETHMLTVKEQQQDFLTQLGLLGAEVARLQVSMKASQEGTEQQQDHLETLHSQIDKLALQLSELENNHTTLASEVKSCCKNTSVTLADVERHVTTLLGDILGLSSSQQDGGGAGVASWSVADMGAWLRSYFVAKEELEARLGTLTATLQKNSIEENKMKDSVEAASNAAMAQSTQIIMNTVLEKLRVEVQRQHEEFSEAANQVVSQQVNTQMQAAAAVLGKQVSEQVDHQLQSSKQQLQHSVSVAVEEAVPKHVASAVPDAVAGAVSEAVADSVPKAVSAAAPGIVKVAVEGAVETAVNAAVDTAVSEAVAAAVLDAVNVAVPNVVNKAVANAVPEALEEALPKAVDAAVQEAVATEVQGAISGTVSEVVASVLPAAVSTAVNETVASTISAAIVDAKLSKATSGHVEGDGMVVVSGSHSDSSSSGGATLSATVNVSKNGNNGSNLFAPVSLPMTAGLNESTVIRIVKEALLKYDADKTGMVDHALESAGGNIVSTRCTESYQVHQAELSILGVPVFWYPTNNNPRVIIQPERMPGQCWAFKGSQGFIVIRLAGTVLPTGFTIEHIPKSLSPSGDIDSAPREFEVWGLQSENDEGILLGNYEYDQNGDPFQYFAVQKENTKYFPLIELKINSNHGNMQYTCLYRFRVHGVRHF